VVASFDSIERDLLMRAVRKHTDCPWVLLYIERWLRAPVQMVDGSLVSFRPRRAKGRGRKIGVSFNPAVSGKALKVIRATVRGWMLHRRSDRSLDDIAQAINPAIRG
jgi:retron-type reverse transcriptase